MNSSNKFICIHGHFYQPPRENAWLEVVEKQDSAAPFHDWNERINFECYAPNAAARILDKEGYIRKIVNNYARISFNIGPTLMSWLELNDHETYQRILEADKISQVKFNGHGTALAQVHSHLILPLANQSDIETQIIWGIKDFQHRFHRPPDGMWLSETAVNTATLEILAAKGIKFTLLAPRQAKAIRKIGTEQWLNGIDPRRPYLYQLPSGNSIVLFFYDGGLSQAVAFEGMLNNGENFAQRLLNGFDDSEEPQLVHIATDGESYGHHHRYGEMALASCLNRIEESGVASVTNYSEYLAKFPPKWEVKIHENTSWSCVHGIERWRSNCGCNGGRGAGWHQKWRAPLRETLDWLRDEIHPIYEKEATPYLNDVNEARNNYIEVLLHHRSPERVNRFLSLHAKRPLDDAERIKVLRLLEMQRQAMQMFTSCGWFFDEISGIETNQILQYANRAIYYAKQVGGVELHDTFLERLAKAPSNVYPSGAESYLQKVLPAQVTLERVGMHYAASCLFAEKPEELSLFNYTATNTHFERFQAGNQRFAAARTIVKSKVTKSEKLFSFAVLYLGQQNIIGYISTEMSEQTFLQMTELAVDAFKSTNLGDVIAIMQSYFQSNQFTIWHLFRDEKRKILDQITGKSLAQAESDFRSIYNDNYQLMSGMQLSEIPIPEAYQNVIQYVVNKDLKQFFQLPELSLEELQRLEQEIVKWKIRITDQQRLVLLASERIFQEIKDLIKHHSDIGKVKNLSQVVGTMQKLGVELDFWKSQNYFYSAVKDYQSGKLVLENGEWLSAIRELGMKLKVRME